MTERERAELSPGDTGGAHCAVMAASKKSETDDTAADTPVEPSKARKAFLAGDITWDELCEAENATGGVTTE